VAPGGPSGAAPAPRFTGAADSPGFRVRPDLLYNVTFFMCGLPGSCADRSVQGNGITVAAAGEHAGNRCRGTRALVGTPVVPFALRAACPL